MGRLSLVAAVFDRLLGRYLGHVTCDKDWATTISFPSHDRKHRKHGKHEYEHSDRTFPSHDHEQEYEHHDLDLSVLIGLLGSMASDLGG